MPAPHKPQRTSNPKKEGLYYSAFGESLIEKNTNYGQFSTPYLDPNGKAPICEGCPEGPEWDSFRKDATIWEYDAQRDVAATWSNSEAIVGAPKSNGAGNGNSPVNGSGVREGESQEIWNKIDKAGSVDAIIGLAGGIGEVLLGLGGEAFTGGISTALVVDGGFRVIASGAKLAASINGNNALSNAIPSNILGLTGKLIDGSKGVDKYDVGVYQSSLGLANDIAVMITPAGNTGAIQSIVQRPNFRNTMGFFGSYYGSTYGSYNNVNLFNRCFDEK